MKIFIKSLLVFVMLFVFGTFQYGSINTPPLFKDSWQSCFVGVALVMSILILLHEVMERCREKLIVTNS